MSQIIKNLASGPVPPSVPTSFITDDGTVIPAANEVNLNGGMTTDDNPNGIQVIANPNLSKNAEFQLTNRAVGNVTTTNATPTTIITFPLSGTAGLYSIQGYVGGYIPASNEGGSYFFDSSIKTDGATATEIGTNYTTVLEDVIMAPSNIIVGVSGNNALIQVEGVAATTIDWVAKFEYTRVS